MRFEYAYEGHKGLPGTNPSGPFLCIIFEHADEDDIHHWAVSNDFGNVFPICDKYVPGKMSGEWEVDCYNVPEKDFIKVCWQAWCIDRGLS